MLNDRTKMRDGDMSLLDRIDVALRRVTNGEGRMRVPVEATDPDVVLFDCRAEIERLRAESMAMRNQRDELRIVLDKRPTMNEGLLDAYAAWSASVYALDWLDAGDDAMQKEGDDAAR